MSQFEKAWANKCNVEFGIAVNSGTSALEIAVRALELDQDAEIILNQGGQFIPFNKDSRVFKYEMQGVLYDESKQFLKGIRHVEGNYDDELDDLGHFTYQPPENMSGMLRYRIAERISEETSIPYVVLVIMWFKYKINNKLNHVFTIAPAKIVSVNQSKDITENITLWDERLSSQGAFNLTNDLGSNTSNKVKKLDENSAQFILQGALDYLTKENT